MYGSLCAFASVDDVARCFPHADEISTDTRLLDQNYPDYHSSQIQEVQLLTEPFRQLPKHEEGLNAPPGPSSGCHSSNYRHCDGAGGRYRDSSTPVIVAVNQPLSPLVAPQSNIFHR